jgi:hypothetical protein
MFKYVPEQLGLSDDIEEDDNTGNRVIIDSFDKLKQKYKSFKPYMTEEVLESYLVMDENMKKAEKWLIGKLHQRKQVKLYQKLYDAAVDGDAKSVKEFKDFSEYFLADEKESEISQFMKNLDLSGIESNE